METMGQIATVIVVALVAAGVIVGVRSVPDIRRYLRMRHM
ncbi:MULTISPECIES: DUF6893 family small protein [Rhodococcus]|uniref:Uncharacterized protein n=1 Tax=Rhodococcus maanshanensis TaxID=183556 RepID=A0A1H7LWB4_9NOCA|nr:hypothetical protein SAMN05444583_105170 [Rhodococcus maanshanensis]